MGELDQVKDEMRKLRVLFIDSYRQSKEKQRERFSLSESLKNAIERVMLFRYQVRYRIESRAKNKARASALSTVRQTLENAAKWKAQNTKTIFNVSLYLLLLDQDLAYFTRDLVLAIGDRRRAFVAKHEALLLYEAAEDVPQLLGREFRNAISALGVEGDTLARINSVSSDLNKYWQKHREFLKNIRNALTAHRELDALLYAESLDAIKPLEVMARAAELSGLLQQLIQALTEIATLTSEHATILRDVLTSNDAWPNG
jgi:hypothetical protein